MNIDKFINLLKVNIETAEIKSKFFSSYSKDVYFHIGDTEVRIGFESYDYNTIGYIDILIDGKKVERLYYTIGISNVCPHRHISNIIKQEVKRREKIEEKKNGEDKLSDYAIPDKFKVTFKDGSVSHIDMDTSIKWNKYYRFKPKDCKSKQDYLDKLLVMEI